MTEAITLSDIYDELRYVQEQMLSKRDLSAVLETLQILQNPDTMRQLRGSQRDLRAGRTKVVRSVRDLLAEMGA